MSDLNPDYLYFYKNIDKLISDQLLITDKEPFVKVEELFNVDINFNLNENEITDDILILYILCIHKISTIKHDNILRYKLLQFFNYHKDQVLIGGNNMILLSIIKQYISDKVLQIQPKMKSKHLE
jgi:hypothetical protein